jgi:glycosyltransferase involved in cell wall biosynthesis
MKFAFITTMCGSAWGGSEELWSQAAVQLKLAGHQVRASVMFRPQISDKLAALSQVGVELETYPAFSYLVGPGRQMWDRLSLGYRRIYRRLRHFKPDLVVISQGDIAGGSEWANVCRDAAIPYVIIVQCNSELWWFHEPDVADAVLRYTSARRVFCVSRGNLNLLRLQVGDPLLNGEVVWNPYNVSTEVVPAWPDESKVWRLACVARMDPAHKGQDLLLQTLARPEWRERPVEVNLFGTGPCELTLRRMAELLQLRSVHFRGHVSDVSAIWEQNHMLVLPSRYEGLPLALVEAMWCGRPAVVTDVAGNAELCTDSETGFVARSATLWSYAQALERAWEKRAEWRRMGELARARAENQIPKDPIGLFCARLTACAAANPMQRL